MALPVSLGPRSVSLSGWRKKEPRWERKEGGQEVGDVNFFYWAALHWTNARWCTGLAVSICGPAVWACQKQFVAEKLGNMTSWFSQSLILFKTLHDAKCDSRDGLVLVWIHKELIAGHGQRCHQDHKLLEVHLPILVLVQVLHDLVHYHGVFGWLEQERNKLR